METLKLFKNKDCYIKECCSPLFTGLSVMLCSTMNESNELNYSLDDEEVCNYSRASVGINHYFVLSFCCYLIFHTSPGVN